MNQLGAAAGSAFGEIMLFDQQCPIAARGGIDGCAEAGSATTDDGHVPLRGPIFNGAERIVAIHRRQLTNDASDEELAEESGIPAEKITDLLAHSRDPVSLDMPVGSDEEAPLGDFIEDAEAMSAENAVISELLHTDIRHVLATLDEREQQVIRLRFGLDDGQPRTLDQIGKLFGLSRERVRQIEREVMAKLRQGERADRLRSYAS